ncbi:MAG: FtsW/RodA/SpoVE family cell cycle protein [Elusimicrobia bacterium]|jgi:rod shape determining protein RodA|nr:FtsW/RodA/SpoVE family cell cycle protein [Elusimicrobiota bacterium]
MKNKIEKIILASILLLSVINIVMVASATVQNAGLSGFWMKQIFAVIVGLLVMWGIRNISYELFLELSPVFYALSVILLVTVLIIGKDVYGSRRWLNLGFLNFQPSELAKLSSIIFGAYLIRKKASVIKITLSFLLLVILVLVEPDAGTALMFLPAYLGVMLVSGRDIRWIFIIAPFTLIVVLTLFTESYININQSSLLDPFYLLIPAVITAVLYFVMYELKKVNRNIKFFNIITVILLFWASWGIGIAGARFLKDYQKKRIVSFMAPDLDPLGAGYNTRQSILAVGSGKFLGKGLYEGTQTQLGFLPVRHTDFIFAVIAEETGFLGSVAVIFLLGMLLWQFIKVIERSEYPAGKMIVSGAFMLILIQATVNLGVTLGLLPVIGIQLPFISYGGSGVIMFMALTGIVLNINRQTEIIGI